MYIVERHKFIYMYCRCINWRRKRYLQYVCKHFPVRFSIAVTVFTFCMWNTELMIQILERRNEGYIRCHICSWVYFLYLILWLADLCHSLFICLVCRSANMYTHWIWSYIRFFAFTSSNRPLKLMLMQMSSIFWHGTSSISLLSSDCVHLVSHCPNTVNMHVFLHRRCNWRIFLAVTFHMPMWL